jgi:stage II sporulation protein AB (anti-sigma F factor)
MSMKNYVRFHFMSRADNVSLARSCVAAFVSQLDCTLDQLEEIKLVVSEAVSNAIIHGYEHRSTEEVIIMVSIDDNNELEIIVEDHGVGIPDIQQAMQPTFSSDPTRMGLGFTFMKSFMDEIEVQSQPGEGTMVILRRHFAVNQQEAFA